jgi:hypothetical protein
MGKLLAISNGWPIISYVVTHPWRFLTVSNSETGARPEEAQHTSVTTVLAVVPLEIL